MRESVLSLLESELTGNLIMNSDFNSLPEITSNQARLLGFSTEKVIVMKESGGPFMIEFANNLERYMAENELSMNEAVENIAEMNNIAVSDINIVLRESDIGKVDIKGLSNLYDFNFVKYTE